ncbi:MAG: Calx-beta domain-containing protein [Pirellulales bacterium]
MRTRPHYWDKLLSSFGLRRQTKKPKARHYRGRQLRHQQFEERRVLTTFSVSDANVTEGGMAAFVISIDAPIPSTAMMGAWVDWSTANNTAEYSDYTPNGGTAMFTPGGGASQTVYVSTTSDSSDEDDETFYVNLSNPFNGSIADGQGVGTITDDDDPPAMTISDFSIAEGSSFHFAVSLATASGKPITVNYSTADHSGSGVHPATAGGIDYTSVPGSLSFAPGDYVKTITLSSATDSIDEFDETFLVNLSGYSNITDGQAIGTILDSNPLPSLSISAGAFADENEDLIFTVTLDAVSGRDVSVNYATSSGGSNPGTPDVDYDAVSGTLVIEAGQTTGVILVHAADDSITESDETFVINLSSPTNATISAPTGYGTIYEDDVPVVFINDCYVGEGYTAAFRVWLDQTSASTVTVTYSTADPGGAQGAEWAELDYRSTSGTLVFNPGERTKWIYVPVFNDLEDDDPEYFSVGLLTITNATAGDISGNAYISGAFTDSFECPCDANKETGAFKNSQPITLRPLPAGLALAGDQQIGLRYNSGNLDQILVALDTTLPSGGTPDAIKAELSFNGTTGTAVWYDPTGLTTGDPMRFVMAADTSGLATGRYNWVMTLTSYDGSTATPRYYTGSTNVINDSNSPAGAGWRMENVDRLVVGDGNVMLVSDYGAATYQEIATDTFQTPLGYTEGLTKNIDGSYTLAYGDGSSKDFNSSGQITTHTDSLGNTTTYNYTSNLLTSIVTGEYTTTLAYTDGKLTSVTDYAGFVTTFGYTGDKLTSITRPDPDGGGALSAPVTTFAYDGTTGLMTSMTDPLGAVTSYTYDYARTVATITENGSVRSFDASRAYGLVDLTSEGTELNPASIYNPADAVSRKTDEHGGVTTYTLDSFGFVLTSTDPLGNVTTYARDFNGRALSITQADPDGAGELSAPVTSFTYDSRGNMLTMGLPAGGTRTWTYDATYDVADSYEDEIGRLWLYEIDSGTGLVLSTRLVVGDVDDEINEETDDIVETYTYTPEPTVSGDPPAGLLASVTDALGNVTEYEYDESGWLTQITNPDLTTIGYTYDSAGNVLTETDELGQTTTYTYDNLGRLLTITQPDPDGSGGGNPLTSPVTTLAYDAAGNVTSITDPNGNVTLYEYNSFSQLVGERRVVGNVDDEINEETDDVVMLYAYYTSGASQGLLQTATDALGNVTTYAYTDRRLTSITEADPDGGGGLSAPVTSFTYDAAGNMLSLIDELDREWTYQYDDLNRLVSKTGPDPDGEGELTGAVWTWQYDANGRVVSFTTPDTDWDGPLDAVETEYEYDYSGRVLSVTDPRGVTEYEYDDLGRLITVTLPDPDGAGGLAAPEMAYAYDKLGRLVSSTDALGIVTLYVYNWRNQVTGTRQVVGEIDDEINEETDDIVTARAYTDVGLLATVTDSLGKTTTYGYDHIGRLLTETLPDPDGAGGLSAPVTTYAYDSNGNMLSLTDPVGNVTAWVYDELNRVISEENENGDFRYFEYDKNGNLVQKTDRNERVTEYEYDNLGRLIHEYWMDGMSVVHTFTYEYDAANRLLAESDEDSAYAYTYDYFDRLSTVDNDGTTGVPQVVLAYAYDEYSRLASVAATVDSDDDFLNTYSYDNLNRLVQITQEGQSGGNTVAEKRIDLGYNAGGQYTSISRYKDLDGGNGNLVIATTYGYDTLGRLTDLDHKDNTTALVAGYDWTFDAKGRVTQFVSSVDGTSDYTYDNTDQLIAADHDYQNDEEYEYDENGNRTDGSFSTGANNKMLSDGTFDYEYDDEGNRISRTRISSDPADDYLTIYEWDYRNRLVVYIEKNNAGDVTKRVDFMYDTRNRRLAKEADLDGDGILAAVVTRYVYDGADAVLTFDENGDMVTRMLHGPAEDTTLVQENAAHALLWALTDNLGSDRDFVDNDGDVLNHVVYNSFGKIQSQTDDGYFFGGFQGAELDPETGLQQHGDRYYDPNTGKWLRPDRIGFAAGDTNLERFVGNSPTNGLDPSGLILELMGAEDDVEKVKAMIKELKDINPSTKKRIEDIENDKDVKIRIGIVRDDPDAAVGSFLEQVIDVGDLEALPNKGPFSRYPALLHELWEQYAKRKDIPIVLDYPKAHIIACEVEVDVYGYKRIDGSKKGHGWKEYDTGDPTRKGRVARVEYTKDGKSFVVEVIRTSDKKNGRNKEWSVKVLD